MTPNQDRNLLHSMLFTLWKAEKHRSTIAEDSSSLESHQKLDERIAFALGNALELPASDRA
jgi:hypothetical protein